MRLEPALWEALRDICRREKTTVHAVCSLVDAGRDGGSLTGAMRVFIVTYFRAAQTETGHALAGHGALLRAANVGPLFQRVDRAADVVRT